MYKTIFVKETLTKLYGDSVEDIQAIVQDYIESSDETIASLQESLNKGVSELTKALHFHSSIFMYIGFPQLTKDCLALENICKQNISTEPLTPLVNSLINCIKETILVLNKEIPDLFQEIKQKLCNAEAALALV